MSLSTLDRVKDELKGTEAYKGTLDEQRLMNYVRTATSRAEGFRFQFEPLYEVKKITPSPRNVNTARGLLTLNEPLLEVFSIDVGGVAITYGTDVVPEPNNGQSPVKTLRIVSPWSGPIPSWYPVTPPNYNYADSITITGLWGMREFYSAQGFFASGLTCPALTASQTTFVVSDVAGPDLYGRVPLLSPGNLIRIDNELMEIASVNATTKTLGVLRGSRNSPAATHALGAAIQIFEPEYDVAQEVTRQACLLYARRGAYGVLTLPDGSSISYPNDLVASLRAVINRFNYV